MRQRTTNATKINKQSKVWEQLATDQFDPWQVVPRQVFTPFSRLLISTALVVVSGVGCLGVTGVGENMWSAREMHTSTRMKSE